ncbi:MAG: hypothetical protein AAB152_15820 [Candidatus Coatesbacteria bacterium]
MNTRRLLPVLPALAILTGCASELKHEITISPKLRELPVHAVCVLEPGFPAKVKRKFADQYPEMTVERLAESGRAVLAACTGALSASLSADSVCGGSEEARGWAAEITADLVKGRVPLSVKPIALPVESVLLLGVQAYGTVNQQTQIGLLWLKPWRIGQPTFDHQCLIQALLVKPQTGEVLFDALLEECETVPAPSAELLDQVARRVGRDLLEAFFPKP